MQQQTGLLANELDDSGMRMPKRIDAYPADQVEIPIPLQVIHVAALPAMQDQRVACVILDQIVLLEPDDFFNGRTDLARRRHSRRHTSSYGLAGDAQSKSS